MKRKRYSNDKADGSTGKVENGGGAVADGKGAVAENSGDVIAENIGGSSSDATDFTTPDLEGAYVVCSGGGSSSGSGKDASSGSGGGSSSEGSEDIGGNTQDDDEPEWLKNFGGRNKKPLPLEVGSIDEPTRYKKPKKRKENHVGFFEGRAFTCVSLILLVVIFCLCTHLYNEINSMSDVYADSVDVRNVNRIYTNLYESIDCEGHNFMVSPLAMNYSIQCFADSEGMGEVAQSQIIETFENGITDWDTSKKWLEGVCKNEGITLLDVRGLSTEKICGMVEDLYSGDADINITSDFTGDGCFSVVELPSGIRATKLYENNDYVYMLGNFFVCGNCFKFDYLDGKHEIIYYTEAIPQDSEFRLVSSSVKIPRQIYSSTVTLGSGVGGIGNVPVNNIQQVVYFTMRGDEYIEDYICEYQVPDNFYCCIRNKETGMVIAGGKTTMTTASYYESNPPDDTLEGVSGSTEGIGGSTSEGVSGSTEGAGGSKGTSGSIEDTSGGMVQCNSGVSRAIFD